MSVTSSTNIAKTVDEPFTVANCAFLQQSTKAVDLVVAALRRGAIALQQGDITPKEPQRLWHRIFPQNPLNRTLINNIYHAWNECVLALHLQRGESLHQSLKSLKTHQQKNPREFKAIVPGINDREFNKAFHHLAAMGYLFKMISAAHRGDAQTVRMNLSKAINQFHLGGVSKNEPSLKRYEQIFLEASYSIGQRQLKEKL